MNVDTFLDTNVFVYLFDERAPVKRSRATESVRTALSDGSACVGFQILAAALDAGCTRLLSEDLQDGQRIEGLRISQFN